MRDVALRLALAERIKSARTRKNLSQSALAEMCNGVLQRTSITNIEAGKQLTSLVALYVIARALDVEPKDLLPSQRELSRYEDIAKYARSKDAESVAESELVQWVYSTTGVDGKHRG